MKMIAQLLIATFTLTLLGCSTVGSKILPSTDSTYLKARSIPPLKMPPGVPSDGFRNDYPVSDRYYPGSDVNPGVVPPGL